MALSRRGENRSACDAPRRRATGHFGSDETLIDEQMFGPVCADLPGAVDKLFGGATSATAAASSVNVPSFTRPSVVLLGASLPPIVASRTPSASSGMTVARSSVQLKRVDQRELDSILPCWRHPRGARVAPRYLRYLC
uniref:Uncharacterized protein n=1 Tax=Plectus sambesii TaxID=2011161 RepID=A0A914VZH6_9BILA